MPYTSETGRQWGRVGGKKRAALHDAQILAKSGQEGLMRRYEALVDPEGTLDPSERAVRVTRMQQAYMRELNIKSVATRRARIAARA